MSWFTVPVAGPPVTRRRRRNPNTSSRHNTHRPASLSPAMKRTTSALLSRHGRPSAPVTIPLDYVRCKLHLRWLALRPANGCQTYLDPALISRAPVYLGPRTVGSRQWAVVLSRVRSLGLAPIQSHKEPTVAHPSIHPGALCPVAQAPCWSPVLAQGTVAGPR